MRLQLAVRRDETRQGRLAGARLAPQDEGKGRPLVDDGFEYFVLRKEVLLPDELFDGAGSAPVREGAEGIFISIVQLSMVRYTCTVVQMYR